MRSIPVLVAGGGASGMVAAIEAAKLGANVTVIEKKNKPGKKILATGNPSGRRGATTRPSDRERTLQFYESKSGNILLSQQ